MSARDIPDTPAGADLHLHTIHSDGALTPKEVVAGALRLKFRAIAITDHDNLAAVPLARQAAKGKPLEIIAGCEFAAAIGDCNELHIVGLFLDDASGRLAETLAVYRCRRRERIIQIAKKLTGLGVRLDADEVFALAEEGSPGRLHVAKILVRRGHAGKISAAFNRFLIEGCPAYVPRQRLNAAKTIAAIHNAAGVAVMAHPALTNGDAHIPALARDGLDAIEVYCPAHNPARVKHYLALAKQLNLALSAGSDCHGKNKDKPLMGLIRLNDNDLEALRARRP